MARKSAWPTNALTAVLVLATEVSGFFLTLSNFQSIASLSVPLGCVFAYNTPMQGCSAENFRKGNSCSSKCQEAITRVQVNIQESCVLVSAGSKSLLNQALDGNLVRALCANTQPVSTVSRPPPQSFTRIPPDTPPATSTTTTEEATSTLTTSITITSTSTSSSTTTSSQDVSPSTSSTTTEATSTSTQQQPTSTAQEASTTSSSSTSTSTLPPMSTLSPTSTLLPTSTSTSTTSRAARPTQPPGGGGSPFDFVPGAATQASINPCMRLLAVFLSVIGVYVL